MKIKLFLTFVLFAVTSQINAQVKIGDNPGTINTNSLLELESANKGFLPPRVAINDLSLVAPLTGTVPAGMEVYSSGGTVTDGYYYWSGTAWVALSTSQNLRNNYVLVKSASDFPAAVGGIITLSAGTIYEINGTITLADMIDLNGSTITGLDNLTDHLSYTGSSELFTGTHGGFINKLILTASTSGAKVFNINAGNADINIIVTACFFEYCSSIGIIQNFGQSVYMRDNVYQHNSSGITFQNDSNLILYTSLWDNTNSNTYHTLIGKFANIQILGGAWWTKASLSGLALDISGITAISGKAFLKSVLFIGDGWHVNGSFTKEWEVESSGINTEKDDIASGNIYITSVTTNTFSASNTPEKIAGTTTPANLFRVTSPANNRLTYTGSKTRRFSVISSLSIVSAGTNKIYSFYIAKNGVVLPESRQLLKMQTSQDKASITLSCTVSLAENDYVEVWIENNSDTSSADIETMNLDIK